MTMGIQMISREQDELRPSWGRKPGELPLEDSSDEFYWHTIRNKDFQLFGGL